MTSCREKGESSVWLSANTICKDESIVGGCIGRAGSRLLQQAIWQLDPVQLCVLVFVVSISLSVRSLWNILLPNCQVILGPSYLRLVLNLTRLFIPFSLSLSFVVVYLFSVSVDINLIHICRCSDRRDAVGRFRKSEGLLACEIIKRII